MSHLPRTPKSQSGLGAIGMLFLFGLIALAALLVIKVVPLYLNQMKIAKVLSSISKDNELNQADIPALRLSMTRHWIIESIDSLKPADVKIRRGDGSRSMSYDYEARAHLFYNIDVVVHFQDDLPLKPMAIGGG